ncbi:MAG: hypothetical protein JXB50_15295, partial [Spirochaetes bacterium]|nr:hypothetical protein [Spirochaetota bacterium]
MKIGTILKIQGYLLVIMSFMMLFPIIFSIYYDGNDLNALLISFCLNFFIGILLLLFKIKGSLTAKDGFTIVTLGWIFAAVFGAMPSFIHGILGNSSFGNYNNHFFNLIDCIFESMSGFTTTGASILTNIEIQEKGLIFWRSMTHWLGGMGIVVLTIAVLPVFGKTSGMLFNAEVPGPIKDRISPKIKDTAIILWIIYFGMTVLQTTLLMIGGMGLFDALCHTFGTLATGGFSTINSSIGGFKSLYIEVIIIIFMYLAGMNFVLHYKLTRGNIKDIIKDKEWKFYSILLISSILLIALNLKLSKYSPELLQQSSILSECKKSFLSCLRYASFQAVSIMTTTGYCTADFAIWPYFSQLALIILMFLGGCAGSTGGGIKQIRIMIMIKEVINEIKKMARPKANYSIKIGEDIISSPTVRNIISMIILFVIIFTFTTLFLALMGYDIITSFAASIATLGNIGPGLARVGAIENYAFFDPLSKIVLTFSMLFGRLEV